MLVCLLVSFFRLVKQVQWALGVFGVSSLCNLVGEKGV